ncbi:MAG TPA: class I SAM-dependent methyltransferase [Vicinamibacteria bacterium]|nr:class I SAM-dependent methyltransferase [Vicinamibacteria bacterium]
MRLFRRSAAVAPLLLFAAAAVPAQAGSRADCEAAHPAARGRPGKDVIWVPTPDEVVHAMLKMAKVTPEDVVVDLGAGDGRVPIAAAKEFGARSVGIEYDAEMVTLAGCLVEAEGAGGRARIVQGDIFKEDFGRATVVTMYLLPELNLCVRHRILAMPPGTRVASHQFSMGEWEADESADVQYRNVYLWVVPARVDGVWEFRAGQAEPFTVDLTQSFGKVGGEIVQGASRRPLVAANLRGTDLRFSFEDAQGATRSFEGKVHGEEVVGVMRGDAGGEVEVRGALRGALRPAPWAEMPALCSRYYDR